jgi:hypothetical protein
MKILGNIISRAKTPCQNKQEPEYVHTLAEQFWRTMLGMAAVIILIAVGFGVFNLVTVVQEVSISAKPTVASSTPTIDRTKLMQTLDGFKKREIQFDTLKNQTSSIEDPSL